VLVEACTASKVRIAVADTAGNQAIAGRSVRLTG
jgi:hypothetical protein